MAAVEGVSSSVVAAAGLDQPNEEAVQSTDGLLDDVPRAPLHELGRVPRDVVAHRPSAVKLFASVESIDDAVDDGVRGAPCDHVHRWKPQPTIAAS